MNKKLNVSIPQAVGTVATYIRDILCPLFLLVSIPQAVGTVATSDTFNSALGDSVSFQYRKR